MELTALTTVAGAALLTTALAEVFKRVWKPAPDQRDRFMPLIALAIGVAVVEIAMFGLGIGTRLDIVQGLITGLMAGFGSSGIYDVMNNSLAGN